jgi:transposase
MDRRHRHAMGKVAKFSEDVARRAGHLVKTAKTTRELRTAMTVLIPRECGVNNVTTARVLGVGVATVVRMQREIRSEVAGNKKPKGRWGGRRRQHLTEAQEREFLEPWVEKAEKGGVLVVPPIHAALEERLGYQVDASTVYRMLARHGWRKVAPDTCHPKRDPVAQEGFKKNSPKRWQKLASGT